MGQHQELFGLDAELPETNASGAPSTNRINSDSQGYGYSYDSAGNMTTGMGQSYSYDGANRLKEVGTGGANVYGYDGDGKRVKKTESGVTTYYVYSSKLGQSVMEVTASSVQRAYVDLGGQIVAMQATDGQFYWLHVNHLGSSRALTDSSGNLAYKGQFDPYGASLTEWSNSGNMNLNSKKFTGYERDSSGLDYAQARMYNSARGRYMTPDPIGLRAANVKRPQSLNSYTYVHNDPINFVDPTGEFAYVPPYHNYGIDGCLRAGGIWAVTGYDAIGRPVWGCIGSSSSSASNPVQNGNSGSGNSGSQQAPATSEIKNFFQYFKNCKAVLNNAFSELGVTVEQLAGAATWNIVDKDHSDWSKKLSDLGFTASDVSNQATLGLTLGEYLNYHRQNNPLGRVGLTNPQTQTVYITSEIDNIRNTRTVMYVYVHETLHLAFGVHKNIIKALGIPDDGSDDDQAKIDKWVLNDCK